MKPKQGSASKFQVMFHVAIYGGVYTTETEARVAETDLKKQIKSLARTFAKEKGAKHKHKSGYIGVYWNQSRQIYQAQTPDVYLGSAKDKVSAAKMYDEYAKKNGLPLNFP